MSPQRAMTGRERHIAARSVMATSRKLTSTGFAHHPKNVCHVAVQASNRRDKSGGGTSNINLSGSWSARILSQSSSRTAFDHRAINSRSSASSFVAWPGRVGLRRFGPAAMASLPQVGGAYERIILSRPVSVIRHHADRNRSPMRGSGHWARPYRLCHSDRAVAPSRRGYERGRSPVDLWASRRVSGRR